MKLKKLTLKNIRSYTNATIEFPDGSILLSGDIGAGKTSILLAIEYAFFGLQPGQRGSSLLANGKDSGSVMLECEINGREVVIERGLKRGSKTVTQDAAAITIDDHRTESSVTEIKTQILELLNYPPEFIKKNNLLYRYTVYTPQEHMKQIILEDPESRLNILRHIFGIDKYKKIKDNLATVTLKLREQSRILQIEVRDLDENKNKRASNKKFIALLGEKIKSKQAQLQKLVEARKSIEREVEELAGKIKEKENFTTEVEKTNIIIASKRDQLADNNQEIKHLETRIAESKGLFDEQLLAQTLQTIQSKKEGIESLNKQHIELSSALTALNAKYKEDSAKKSRIFQIDICPTCLQDVSETHKHNILNETETQLRKAATQETQYKQALEKLVTSLEKEKIDLVMLEQQKSDLQILKIKTQNIKESEERLTTLKNEVEVLAKDIGLLEKHVQTLKQSSLEFSKFDNLQMIKKDELRKAFETEKQTEIEIAENNKELEITKREIDQLTIAISKTEQLKQKLVSILEVESWLTKEFLNLINFTERNIMLTLRNEFSKLFSTWFAMLTTDAFHVHLDENFTPIITQNDFELEYSYLSGGERTAVALAYRLALNQLLNSMLSKIKTQDLVILDEPTDGFSDAQLDKVRDILQELHAQQIILVSHEQKIESFVDNVIRLNKVGGVSAKE